MFDFIFETWVEALKDFLNLQQEIFLVWN